MEPAATERVSATFHAFINHRGTDVKKTLASLIYHCLTKYHGLRVFLDQKELHAGDKLSPAIIGAINSASVHVAIFSEHYAESPWCLDELWTMLRSKGKIIPVFYNVEPMDLRHIDRANGRYRKAFEDHQRKGRYSMEDIQKWREALNEASEISGIEFKTVESDHGVILESIVQAVLKAVEREPSEMGQKPVGLDQAVAEIDNIIKRQSELNGTAIVGIAGMPGIGKSTLATFFYNLKRPYFSRSCYLSEINKRELPNLQQQLHYDLLGWERQIENTKQGKNIFRNLLGGHKVLIVLDDVHNTNQIDSLLFTDVVGSGSLILITSHDQDLLKRSSPKIEVYMVKLLEEKLARELFCQHVFAQSEPLKGFHSLVKEVVKFCDGLPLCIRVLAGHFFQCRDDEDWKKQLGKLSRRLPKDIMGPLRLSYEDLDYDEKGVFLDVSCFLVGEDKELAVRVLEGLGYKHVRDCLENLRQRCFIEYTEAEYHDDVQYDDQCDDYRIRRIKHGKGKGQIEDSEEESPHYLRHFFIAKDSILRVSKRHKITMHDHFRLLARDITREEFGDLAPRKAARLSCPDDIEELILKQGGAGSCLVRGIRITKGQNLPGWMNDIKSVGVQLFVAEDPINQTLLLNITGNLVWLRLCYRYRQLLPETISLKNLRVLELSGISDLDNFFSLIDEPPQNLNVLDIDETHAYSSRISSGISSSRGSKLDSASQDSMIPNFIRFLEGMGMSIEVPSKIVLKNNTILRSLPINFQKFKTLKHLDLSGCSKITQLPNSFSVLKHLQYLALRNCSNLSIPRIFLGELTALEHVDFQGCSRLEYLPTGITNQRSLRYLNLLATRLNLPIDLKLPNSLEHLSVGTSRKARPLQSRLSQLQLSQSRPSPADCRRLKDLEELILIGCQNLSAISAKQIAGPKIKLLVIVDCPICNFSFKDQGTMYVDMGNLREFTLMRTRMSEMCIPEGVFTSLETLNLSENSELTQVKGLPSTLLSLDLHGCTKLTEVKFSSSALIVRLNLEGCWRLKALTDLSNLVDLKFLSVNRCYKLETLNVEGLTSLEVIRGEACWKLKSMQGLSQLKLLKCLGISTSTDVIWNDICDFLTSTSHDELSTAFFTGRLRAQQPKEKNTRKAVYEMTREKVHSITGELKLKVVDVVFRITFRKDFKYPETSSTFDTKMEDLQSYGAILMFFLAATPLHGNCFRVKFEASSDDVSAEEYIIGGEEGIEVGLNELHLHVFMWTEECDLFRDYKGYDNIVISSNMWHKDVSGWIMMVAKNTSVLQVAGQIIMICRKNT